MKRRFAWWPKKLNDGYTIWLGFYVSSEVWDPHNLWTATDRYLDGHAGT